MKILVYGAGVLGTLNAARLHEASHEVSLLARGSRLAALREHGVRLAEGDSATIEHVPVPVVDRPDEHYDLITVFVRSHQVDGVIDSIVDVHGDVLFLLNWAAGPNPLTARLGRERVLLGFGNQGGTMDGDVVRYRRPTPLTRLVSMPIGELDGRTTPRLERIMQTFRSAGFSVTPEPRIDDWLRTHAAFEVPLGQAVHAAGGPDALAADTNALRAMIGLIRLNLTALPNQPVPRAFSALNVVPEPVLVPVFRRFLHSTAASPLNTTGAAVTGELELLAEQLRQLADAH